MHRAGGGVGRQGGQQRRQLDQTTPADHRVHPAGHERSADQQHECEDGELEQLIEQGHRVSEHPLPCGGRIRPRPDRLAECEQLIWDLGGTLVDTYPDVDRALASAIESRPSSELLHEVAQLTRVSSSHAISTLATRHDVSGQRLRTAYEATKLHWQEHPPPVNDGARELLAAVQEQGGLNLVCTHRDRDSAAALLDSLDLQVHDMVCAPDGYARKPDPEMVHALLALLTHSLRALGLARRRRPSH